MYKKLKLYSMNYKTRMMFAISLAAIFSVSLVSIGDMPQAIADKDKHDDKSKKHFFQKSLVLNPRIV